MCPARLGLAALPAPDGGGPGEAGAKAHEPNPRTRAEAALRPGIVERQWHRSSAGVPEAVDVGVEEVVWHAEVLRDRLQDADVRLVSNHQIQSAHRAARHR